MDTTSPTTVVLHDHRDTISAAIVDILSDWHSSGWISNVAFITVAEVEGRGGDIGNAVVSKPASAERGPVRQRIKDVLDNPQVRLVAIDPVGSESRWIQRRRGLKRAADSINSALTHRHAAIDVVVMWHGGNWDPDALEAWKGWDTVLVAPEESSNIQAPGTALFCSLDSPPKVSELASHAAAFTASMVGLWSGIEQSPFDHTDDIDDVRMGRCVHRRLDASQMTDRLRSMALDPRSLRDPNALHSGNRSEFDRRIEQLRTLLNLADPPPNPRRPKPQNVGPIAALKAFFAFMFAAIRRAPKEMVGAAAYRGKAALAEKIQRATYGQNSAFLVTVGGVSAADADISTEGLSDVVESLHEAVGDLDGLATVESAVGISQQPFWSGVFDNAFALVSGTRQGGGEQYLTDGKARYFKVSEVAPRITSPWRPEGSTVSGVPAEGIDSFDMLEIRGARMVLGSQAEAESPGTREIAKRNIRSLAESTKQWREAFVGRVGEMLADTLLRHVDGLAKLIREAQESTAMNAKAAKLDNVRRSRRRVLRIISGVFFLATVLAIVLHFTLIPALSLLIALPVLLLTWLISAFGVFFSHQKKIFQLENELAESAFRYEVIRSRLPFAVENVRRMVRVYDQYLVWAQALSLFLNEPYGRAENRPHDFLGMVGAMPKSVSCGIYEVTNEGQANEFVRNVTQNLRYPLTDLWLDFVRASHDLLVRKEPHLGSLQVDDILAESEVGEDSYLDQWLTLTGSRSDGLIQVSPVVAGEVDRRQMGRILDHIDRTRPEVMDQIRAAHTVRKVGDGGLPSSHRISPHDTPADFNNDAFSFDGKQQRSSVPDLSAFAVMSSSAIRTRSTRHWLDEVDTAVSMTSQLTFDYLELRSVTAPNADEFGFGDTSDTSDDTGLEDLKWSDEPASETQDPDDDLGELSL